MVLMPASVSLGTTFMYLCMLESLVTLSQVCPVTESHTDAEIVLPARQKFRA